MSAKVPAVAADQVLISDCPIVHLRIRWTDPSSKSPGTAAHSSAEAAARAGEWRMTSKVPTKKKNGAWVLHFGGKFMMRSIKNAILLDEQALPVILIHKLARDVLEVETIRGFTRLQLFVLGIASFLCPI